MEAATWHKTELRFDRLSLRAVAFTPRQEDTLIRVVFYSKPMLGKRHILVLGIRCRRTRQGGWRVPSRI